jgi:hypothetical protein
MLPWTSTMNPRCVSCNQEMKIAKFGARCFVCEACREFFEVFEVGEMKDPLPWSDCSQTPAAAEIRLELEPTESKWS